MDTMYFEEMLKSHINDIDKYINTIFFIETLLRTADHLTVVKFPDNPLKQLVSTAATCSSRARSSSSSGRHRGPHQAFPLGHLRRHP